MEQGRFTVSIERITIEASNATVGMYVSKLDRPWLETPFVFQGFEIKSNKEIDMLRQYCSEITVDVYRGSLTRVQISSLLAAHKARAKAKEESKTTRPSEPSKLSRWLKNLLLRMGVTGRKKRASTLEAEGYKVTSTVRGEAGAAMNSYARLCRVYERERMRATEHGKVSRATLDKAAGPVVESILRNPDAMAWTVFSRRQAVRSIGRAVGTAVWCVMFGRHLSFDRRQLHELALGGLLLDIGTVRLPPGLGEHEGDVTEDEFSWLAQHVDYGLDILVRSGDFSRNIVDMVAHHHERADGSGYPARREGPAIPAFARIAGIADTFDAMTSENAYSPAYAAYDVSRALHEMSGQLFDSEVVEQFLRTVGMFPTGSVVELNNGMIGLVIEQNRIQALRPKVMLLLDSRHRPLKQPQFVELRDLPPTETQQNAVWIVRGHPHGAFGIDPTDYFKPRLARR
jgi:HD-GYP domain-containing protein (c-di-GMP phosphodiesterase class II)